MRIVSAIMVLAMLLSFAACVKTPDPAETTAPADTTAAPDESTAPEVDLSDSLQIELITTSGLTVTDVVWSSGNPDVLVVSEDGLITMAACAPGRYQYIAEVALSDGSTHTLTGWCECPPQE